jgi:hypothetical protein
MNHLCDTCMMMMEYGDLSYFLHDHKLKIIYEYYKHIITILLNPLKQSGNYRYCLQETYFNI